MTDTPTNPVQLLWQQQPAERIHMSIDEVRRRAVKFEKRIFWLNAREYIAGAVGMGIMAYLFLRTHDSLSRAAFGLLIAGTAYALFHLYLKGRPGTASEQIGAQCANFFLEELERTRRLVNNLWWYLGPLVPGMLLLTVASARLRPQPVALLRLAIADLVVAGAFVFVIRLNKRAARCLQKQIDELRSLQEQH